MSENNLPNHTAPTHVVGIGASAGGLEPLSQFFDNMPNDSGMAFVIIQHLSPDFDSMMKPLLARHTEMTIQIATMGMALEANTIYLNTARQNMIVSGGQLMVTPLRETTRLHLPIDSFLNSLALDFGPRSVAVILSGAGSDGSRGIRAVHHANGFVAVQDKRSAGFDGMPASAINTHLANIITDPPSMPQHILKYVESGTTPALNFDATFDGSDSADSFAQLLRLLYDKYQIEFSMYKAATLKRRIERRLLLLKLDSLDSYVEQLRTDSKELEILYRDVMVDVTQFFRDTDAFTTLEQKIIPEIVTKANSRDEIRIWVAGCASGEEAFSIGILIAEEMERQEKKLGVRIFATDAHQESINRASLGIYEESLTENVTPERLARYFVSVNGGYQISKEIRKMVIFAYHDMIESPPFTRLDLVSCRNVLIYMEKLTQHRILSNFHFSLKTQGFLILGPSEQPGPLADEFDTINSKWRIYRKRRDVVLPNVHVGMPSSAVLDKSNRFDFQFEPPTKSSQVARISQTAPNEGRRPERKINGSDQSTDWMESLLMKLIPSGIVVDQYEDIRYIYGDAQRYLHLRHGHGSLNVYDLLDDELATALRLAIAQVRDGEGQVTIDSLHTTMTDGTDAILKVTVISLPVDGERVERCFVGFESLDSAEGKPVQYIDLNSESTARLERLEFELTNARDLLQNTIESQESMNEELTMANEELQASNEELSATNEELFTVNTEYQRSITDLTQLTTDLENLQISTQIGVLFLDPSLCIRSFTTPAARILGLVDADKDRSIAHLSFFNLGIEMTNLEQAANQVLADGNIVELETKLWKDCYYLLRILPYRTESNDIEGVVLALIDISARKESQLFTQQVEQYFDIMAGIFYVLDTNANLTRINPTGAALLGYTEDELIGRNWHDLICTVQRRTERKMLFRSIMAGDTQTQKLEELVLVTKSGQEITMLCHTTVLTGEYGESIGTATSGYDVTERKEIEMALSARTNQLRTIANNLPTYIVHTDAELNIRLVNQRFTELAQMSEEELEGQNLLTLFDKEFVTGDKADIDRVLAGESITIDRFIHSNGTPDEVSIVETTLIPEIEAGQVVGVVVLGIDVTRTRRQSRFIRAITENDPNYIYVYSVDKNEIIYRNRDLRRELGYNETDIEAVDGPFLPSITHPDDKAAQESHRAQVLQNQQGEVVEHEYRVRKKNGDWLWLMSQETVFRRWPDGSVAEILGTITDITQKKQAELDLEESQRFLKSIFDASPAVLYIFDVVEERNIFTSREYDNDIGYSIKEIHEMGADVLRQLMHPDDYEARIEHHAQLARSNSGEAIYREFRLKHRDGSWRWFSSYEVVHERDHDGRIRKLLGVRQSITAKKEEELRNQEQTALFEAVLNAIPDAILVSDANRTITMANPSVKRIFGYEPEEIMHQSTRLFYTTNDAYQELGQRKYDSTANDYLKPFQQEFQRKDGTRFTAEVVANAVILPDGATVGNMGVIRDVTERKRTEAELMAITNQLRVITNGIPARITYVDTERRIQFANRYVDEIAEISPDDVIGSPVEKVMSHISDYDNYIEMALSGKAAEYEITRRGGNDGQLVYEQATLVPDIVNGEVKGFFSHVVDITEHKKALLKVEELSRRQQQFNVNLEERVSERIQELEDANQELMRINANLEQVVSDVSHTLVEPLDGLEEYSQILLESQNEQIDADSFAMIAKMARLTIRAKRILDALRNESSNGKTSN